MSAWETVTLREVAESLDYGVTAPATWEPKGSKFLRITDIRNGSVDWNQVPWCESSDRGINGSRLRPGDIVFARTGSTGNSLLIRDCPEGAVFASYLIRVRLNNSVDPNYMSHFLRTPDYWSQIASKSRGAIQSGVNASTLGGLKFPLPPLADQRRIAAILGQIDSVRAMRRESLVQLNELTESIFLDMFDPSLGMRISSLGEQLSFITSGGRGWARFYADNGQRFIRSLDVRMNRIDERDAIYVTPPENAEARRTAVKAGDVLLTITGSRIGRVATVPEELEGAHISQHVAILRPRRDRIRPEFLSFFLSSGTCGQRQIASAQYGQTKPGLNFQQIREFKIPIPTLSLQNEFVARVAEVESLVNENCSHLAELDALFASLQYRAFRGEL